MQLQFAQVQWPNWIFRFTSKLWITKLFGISDVFTTQLAIIVCVVAVSTISAVTGIDKGFKL